MIDHRVFEKSGIKGVTIIVHLKVRGGESYSHDYTGVVSEVLFDSVLVLETCKDFQNAPQKKLRNYIDIEDIRNFTVKEGS